MKALTVRQPWAWAIIHGGKDVENRSRNIVGSYRGPLAIHAALRPADEIDTPDRLVAQAVGRLARAKQTDGMAMVPACVSDPNDRAHWVHERFGWRGAIIGVVDLINVHEERPHWSSTGCACPSDWGDIDCWHLALANPRPLAAPIPYKGRLGLWDVPDELVADLAAEAVD